MLNVEAVESSPCFRNKNEKVKMMKCEYRFTHFPKVEVKQKCKTDVNIHVKCHGENGNSGDETAAFRAVNNANQPIDMANQFYKVLFQEEQFDIGDIYNANNSTFVPRQSGVYYVAGTVTFIADDRDHSLPCSCRNSCERDNRSGR